MALSKYENQVLDSFVTQWGTEQGFNKWLDEHRVAQKKAPTQQAPAVTDDVATPTTTWEQPTAPTFDGEQDEGLTGFISETWEALKQRGSKLAETQTRLTEKARVGSQKIWDVVKEKGLGAGFVESMKQQLNQMGSSVQFAWDIVMWGTDIVWEWIENFIQDGVPEIWEEAVEAIVTGAVTSISNTDTAQAIAKSYWEFKEKNPEAARNIEGFAKLLQDNKLLEKLLNSH